MAGLRPHAGAWAQFCLATYVMTLGFVSFAMFNASMAPSLQMAQIMQGSYLSVQNSLAGMTVPWPALPRGWKWLYRMLPSSHTMEAITMTQFSDKHNIIDVVRGTTTIQMPARDFISMYTGWSYGADLYWKALAWVLLYIVCMQLAAFVANTFLVHQKR